MLPRTTASVFFATLLLGCSGNHSPAPATKATGPAVESSATPAEVDLSGTLGELTQAVRKFSAEQRRVPASLNDLVSAGYLKQVPPAPAGKSFAIDSKELKVVLR